MIQNMNPNTKLSTMFRSTKSNCLLPNYEWPLTTVPLLNALIPSWAPDIACHRLLYCVRGSDS